MVVPFIDLDRQHRPIRSELEKVVLDAVRGNMYLKGPEVGRFEKNFAGLLNASHCVATANGTDALFLALTAAGIGPGDEVITPAFSWISSSETISACGASLVFADVDPETYTLSPRELESKISKRTRAVVVVHLYGMCADMPAITKICENHNLLLVEDCAQAHCTMCLGKAAGTFGDFGCFSFYPTKNLGALGDAGCVLTSDADLSAKVRRLANHGALNKDDHEIEGHNSRMDTIQAAVLLAKLPFLAQGNADRQRNADIYCQQLGILEETALPASIPGFEHTFHLFVIRARFRDELRRYLASNGVETMVHYPSALPNLPAYRHLGFRPADFPVASRLQDEVLSLPIFPGLTPDEITYVCDKIKDFYGSR